MKRTTVLQSKYVPSADDKELCSLCQGSGDNRGGWEGEWYCTECGGTGEQPKGTDHQKYLEKIRALRKIRDDAQNELDKLGYYDL